MASDNSTGLRDVRGLGNGDSSMAGMGDSGDKNPAEESEENGMIFKILEGLVWWIGISVFLALGWAIYNQGRLRE